MVPTKYFEGPSRYLQVQPSRRKKNAFNATNSYNLRIDIDKSTHSIYSLVLRPAKIGKSFTNAYGVHA